MEIKRANNDSVGHPRYIVHFFGLLTDKEKELPNGYEIALKRAKKLKGRKYTGKDFGGGIVFREYCPTKLEEKILKLEKV